MLTQAGRRGQRSAVPGGALAVNAVTGVCAEMALRLVERSHYLRVAGLGCLLVCTGFALAPLSGMAVRRRSGVDRLWTATAAVGLRSWAGFVALARRPVLLAGEPAWGAASPRALEALASDE